MPSTIPTRSWRLDRVPGPFQPPAMTDVKDFALSKSDLDVINPGPGEYVHVMEGRGTAMRT